MISPSRRQPATPVFECLNQPQIDAAQSSLRRGDQADIQSVLKQTGARKSTPPKTGRNAHPAKATAVLSVATLARRQVSYQSAWGDVR